jgi:hypothetical protein
VDLGNPSNDATTFDSQSTFILPYTHADGHKTLVYMGDRWNADGPGGLKNSSYIWCVARPRCRCTESSRSASALYTSGADESCCLRMTDGCLCARAPR